MNQYLVYLLIAVGLLLVALVIPGLKVVAELVLKAIAEFFGLLLQHKMTFFVWAVKTLVGDHSKVLVHALKSRDELDPTFKVRRKAEGYDD